MKMKWDDHGIKTPLARAQGLGSARDGVEHWLWQRITAISNLILMSWLVVNIVCLARDGMTHDAFTSWLAMPHNAILMILSIVSVFYHAILGSQVVIEDYIHHEGFKMFKLIGTKLFFTAMAVACIFSVLKIAL